MATFGIFLLALTPGVLFDFVTIDYKIIDFDAQLLEAFD